MIKALKWVLYRLWLLAAAGVVLAAIFLTVARIATPFLGHYRTSIEQWAGNKLSISLQIGGIEAIWRGLEPSFKFSNVKVLNPERTATVVDVDTLYFGIDLWDSLTHAQLYPGHISVDGVHLTVNQSEDNHFSLIGLKHVLSQENANQKIDYTHVLGWLLSQKRLLVKNISVDFLEKNGGLIQFNNITARLKNSNDNHFLEGQADLIQDTPTTIVFTLKGTGQQKNLRGRFFLNAKGVSLKPWKNMMPFSRFALNQGVLNVNLQGKIRRGDLTYFQLNTELGQLNIKSKLSKVKTIIEKASALITWEKIDDKAWQLLVDNMRFTVQGKELPENRLTIFSNLNKITGQQEINLTLDHFRALLLGSLAQWVSLPDDVAQAVAALQPTGMLSDIAILIQKTNDSPLISAGFSFDHLTLKPWKSIPGVNGLRGRLDMDDSEGALMLDTGPVNVQFATLFRKELKLDALQTELNWKKTKELITIRVPHFLLKNTIAMAGGQFQLDIPKQGESSIEMVARLTAKKVKNADVSEYLPVAIMTKDLVSWLDQSIKQIDQFDATMVLRGNLNDFPFQNKPGTFLVEANFDNALLDYQPKWPAAEALSGDIKFSANSMSANLKKGSIAGIELLDMQANIPKLSGNKVTLELLGNAKGDFSDGLDFLTSSPLSDVVGKSISELQGSGAMDLNLDIQIPLYEEKGKSDVKVNGKMTLTDASVSIPKLKLKTTIANGEFSFTEDSLNSNTIETSLFGFPASLAIKTDAADAKEKSKIRIEIASAINTKAIREQYQVDLSPYFKGQTQVKANLVFNNDQVSHIKVESDLMGLISSLPPPFNKTKNQSWKSQADIKLIGEHQFEALIDLGGKATGKIYFHKDGKDWKLEKGNIHIGKGNPDIAPETGITITGSLDALNLNDWLTWVNQNKSTKNQTLNAISLNIGRLKLFDLEFTEVATDLKKVEQGWQLSAVGDQMDGTILIPENKEMNLPIQADFSKLFLSKLMDLPDDPKKNSSDPTQLLPFNFQCQNFKVGDRQFGQVKIVASKKSNGLHFEPILARNKSFNLSATGDWTIDNAKVIASEFNGNLKSSNLADTLKAWKITEHIQSQNAQFSFSTKWNGDPFDFNLAGAKARVNTSIRNGAFIGLDGDTNSKVGFGQLITLLSLESITKRMRLDFQDLTHKGYYFDSLKGDFEISDGKANTRNLHIDGVVADIKVHGSIGLIKKDYNLILTVIPNLTGSLPVLATLAAGPVAGVLTFVFDKTVGSQVNKISSSKYKIMGTFSDPIVVPLNKSIPNNLPNKQQPAKAANQSQETK